MKRLWIFAIASAVLLTGCASDQAKTESGAAAGGAADMNSAPAITEIAREDITIAETETQPPEKCIAPPEIRISTTTEMTASAGFLTKGAYSWNYEDNGEMVSVITDCALPSEIEKVNVGFDPDELTSAPKIAVPVGAKIVKIECWNGTATQSVGFTEDGEVKFPVEPIGNTYCVTIEFSEGWGSYGEYGTCDYIFRTTHSVSDAPTDSGNSTESVPPVTAQSSAGFNPEEIVQHPGHIVSDPIEKTPEPPELSLGVFFEHSDEQLEVILSPNNTFTWSFVDSHGHASTICVDCPAPYQMDLEPDFDIIDADKARVELTDDGRLAGVTNWSDEGERLDVDFQCTGEMYFPKNPIGDIYSIEVEFPEGNCTYVFAASCDECGEVCGYPRYEDMYEVKPGGEPVMTPPSTIYRVHDFNDSRLYPDVIVIDSIEALKLYFGENNNTETGFELDSMDDELFSKYDRRFFDDNALIFVRIMEGSGSVSHEFRGIDHDNNIIILRTEPQVGTCDMAYYHMVIEIPQGMAGNDFGLITNTVFEGDWYEELVPQQPDGIE